MPGLPGLLCLLAVSSLPARACAAAEVLQIPAAVTAAGTAAADLRQARRFLHQGLLAEAEARLARLPPDASPRERASAALLSGNILYERGAYLGAEAAYSEAESLLLLAPAADDAAGLLQAARNNLRMAQDEVSRKAALDVHSSRLRAMVLAVLAGTALIIVFIGRRSAR